MQNVEGEQTIQGPFFLVYVRLIEWAICYLNDPSLRVGKGTVNGNNTSCATNFSVRKW